MEQPTGRYDIDGNLYIDIPPDLADTPLFPLARFALTSQLPDGAFDWEPGGGTLWARWDQARAVERRLHDLWPDAVVTAAANPAYRSVAVGQ